MPRLPETNGGRPPKEKWQRYVAVPGLSCHQSIAIDQDRYWVHIAKRNERNVVGWYEWPL